MKPRTWMLISLMLFAASAWMWQVGERVNEERNARVRQWLLTNGKTNLAAMLPKLTQPNAATPVKVAVKPPASYVLTNTPQSKAQLARNERGILLRNALIDTSRRTPLDIPDHLRAHGAPGSYIVQSARALDAGFYTELAKDGAEVVSYIPNNAVLARVSAEAAKTLAADPVFAAVLPYEPYYKLDETLLPEAVEQTPMTNSLLRVTIFKGQTAAAAQALTALGAQVAGRDETPFGTALIANVPPDKLVAVAQMPQAQEIESCSPRRMMNDLTRARLGVASSPTNTTDYQGLTGSNIWVVVNDTGVDSNHPAFTGRLTYDPNPYASAALQVDTNGHGTHVAGIIGGSGAGTVTGTNIPGSGKPAANQFRGMASASKLFVQGADPTSGAYLSDFYLQTNASYWLMTNTAGATTGVTNGFVNNCSWGYESTAYDEAAAGYDAAVRNAQPNYPGEHSLTYVFAAGDGFGGGIRSPGTAKNVITVGATDSPRQITNQITLPGETNTAFWSDETASNNAVANLSSAGNVDVGTEGRWGRFKPDLVAPGIFIISARSAAFKDPALLQTKYYWEFGGSVAPGAIYQVGAIYLPTNITTSNVFIQVTANDQSPVPFPTDYQIYFDTNTPPTFAPATLLTMTNQAGLAVGPAPPATNCYIGLSFPATNLNQPVSFNMNVWVLANETQYGPSFATNSYFGVLSNLDSALLPDYRYESGTSMAAAAVSGLLADMQEFLSSKLNTNPSPALLKALLINGARPLNKQSDLNPQALVNSEGWGLPNLSNSVPASLATNSATSMVFFDQSPSNALQTGQWDNYQVTLDPAATNFPLRITLVWTDPPGNPAAGIALVNNLELMVADSTGTNLYIGNDFPAGGGPLGCFTQASPTNSPDAADIVNNVQCVNLYASAQPPVSLSPPFTISVRAARVNVNAVSTQTNAILQDYALVVSSDDQSPATGLSVVNLGITTGPPAGAAGTILAGVLNPTNVNTIPTQNVTVLSNATALIHQRVGGNEPNLWGANTVTNVLGTTNTGTNGNPLQWHFFVLANTATTNTALYGTNAANFTNAVFATFLPPSLTFPSFSPANMSPPAINNADIDLYVSTNSALTNLDETALAASLKSLGRGGDNMVIFTNATSNQVYYAGVKSETQQGADFGFFAEITTNLTTPNGDGSVTGYGQALPVAIPDDTPGDLGAFVFAPVISTSATTARKVAVLVGLEHSNPADLQGTISLGQTQSTVNYYTATEEAGFTNWYDDLPDGSVTNPIPTDSPGTLKNFVGQPMNGMYILNQKDNALLQTGMVTTLQVRVWPQPPNPLDFFIPSLAANGWYYGFVDLPDDSTNLLIQVAFNNGGPLGIFLDNADDVSTNDYGVSPIPPPGGQLDDPSTNLDIPPTAVVNPPPPALTGGRWYYGIYNENATAPVTNIQVVITIAESLTPNLTLTQTDNTATNLQTDAHTQSQICVTNGILTNSQQLVSLQVGVRLTDTNLDDLVLHLTSPQGTSVLLFEDRGGTNATDLGLTVTNATNSSVSYGYTTFTENTNLASQLIKFAAPPYALPTTNAVLFDSDFDTATNGDYGPPNSLIPATLGDTVEQWTVLTNDVAVVAGSGLYQAYDGETNYLALANGQIEEVIPTVVGLPYSLTFAYLGPGLVDWWPFEGDAEDVIGTNNGTITSLLDVVGDVGQGFQFNGVNSQIDFGTNAGNFGTNDFTIDYWMNTSNSPATGVEDFLAKRIACGLVNALDITVGHGNPVSPGILQMTLRDDGTPGSAGDVTLDSVGTYNDGLWHHVAWVRRAGAGTTNCVLLLYVDGQLNNSLVGQPITFVTNSAHLIMGQDPCGATDGRSPYSGAADELDLWNRALSDVEIAAIYEAGSLGKKGASSYISPNCQVLVNGATNTTLFAPASGTNWITNGIYFTAVSDTTTVVFQGNPLGMLFDDFQVSGPTNLNYVLPEGSLSPFTGENPAGCWTLDVWDTRTDSPLPTNGVLLSWNLQMTLSAAQVTNLIVLTNHQPYTTTNLPGNQIQYFAFDVPYWANYATNTLTNNGTTNLTLLFNQAALPTGSLLGDYTLLNVPSSNTGVYVLTNNAPPPALVPGQRYFLGVENNYATNGAFSIEVDTDTPAGGAVTALTNGLALPTNIAVSSTEYYSFAVTNGAILAAFEITNASSPVGLYVRHALPLPGSTDYDYATAYDGTNEESIVVTTNCYPLTNSAPVPLTPGTWYLTVSNLSATSPATYTIVATCLTNTNAINLVPLTNWVAGVYQTNWTSAPGPALTNFFSFTLTNSAPAVQFAVTNTSGTGNVDLIVGDGYLPTPQQMTDGSFNSGTLPQVVTIVNSSSLPWTNGTTWYLGVPNNGTLPTTYNISAVTLTNTDIFTSPAFAISRAALVAQPRDHGFTMGWPAVAGGQYEVLMTTNLTSWTVVANITTGGSEGNYTDPAPISTQPARFYRVVRTH